MFNNFLRQSCRLWDNAEAFYGTTEATNNDTIWRAHFLWWIRKATQAYEHAQICGLGEPHTHTHTQRACAHTEIWIFTASPRRQWFANAPRCYVARTLPVLFFFVIDFFRKIFNKFWYRRPKQECASHKGKNLPWLLFSLWTESTPTNITRFFWRVSVRSHTVTFQRIVKFSFDVLWNLCKWKSPQSQKFYFLRVVVKARITVTFARAGCGSHEQNKLAVNLLYFTSVTHLHKHKKPIKVIL